MGHHVYTTVQSHTVPIRRFRVALTLCVAVAFLLATSSAKAACGFPHPSSKVGILPVMAHDDGFGEGRERNSSIIGLWHVKYDSPTFDSFKVWHTDGTESESANLSPLDGNICIGVWTETRYRTVRLHHVGWIFANGVLTGSVTIDELNTVASDGQTYTGTHTFTFYDPDGNMIQQVTGSQTAKRITVNSTGAP